MPLHEVDLLQSESQLLLPLKHLLLELLQCQSTSLRTGFRGVIKEFLELQLSCLLLAEGCPSLDHGLQGEFLIELHVLEVITQLLDLIRQIAVVVKCHREVLKGVLVLILV